MGNFCVHHRFLLLSLLIICTGLQTGLVELKKKKNQNFFDMPPISTTCTLKTTQHTLSAREAEHRGFDLDRTVAVLPSLPSCWCRRSPRNQCLRGCIPQCWHDSAGLDWGEGWGPSQFLFFDHHLLRFSFLQNHIFHIQFFVKTYSY